MARTSRKDEILSAAMELFAERGVDAVSLREVNAKANMSAAALHYHFKNRDALVKELVENIRVKYRAKRVFVAEKFLCKESVTLHDVVHVLIWPLVDCLKEDLEEGMQEIRFVARLYFDNSEYLRDVFSRGWTLFSPFLIDLLPDLTEAQIKLRWSLTSDLALQGIVNYEMLMSQGFDKRNVNLRDMEEEFDLYISSLIDYLAAGLQN